MTVDWNLESGGSSAISTGTYNDGKWHQVAVERKGKSVMLTVDGTDGSLRAVLLRICKCHSTAEVSGESEGSNTELKPTTIFYVGGLPPYAPL